MQTGYNDSSTRKEYPLWLFMLLPAISMLLGWGLRGFIGGGPFGAMIPGAMVVLAICMLLDIPFGVAAVMVVFGTAGIGMGGEMTYGQTLGFLRDPATVWWGTCGTTLKGGVWGLVGGVFVGLGLTCRSIKIKTIVTGLLLFLIGFIIGLKLINDPKVLYFSDPINKPRQESWAGLLFAAVAMLFYLKLKLTAQDFRIIFRFARYGLLGGALGFGLGAFWIVAGSRVAKDSWITEWWKLMEFSFGCIMGGFFGYAAWLSRKEIKNESGTQTAGPLNGSFFKQLVIAMITGVLIYLVLPLMDPFVEARSNDDGAVLVFFRTITRVTVNYTFMGALLILVALNWPFAAFQLAITLTFTHTMIDLVKDLGPEHGSVFSPLIRVSIVLLTSVFVGFLVAVFQRKRVVLPSMFLLLVWSTVAVAITRMVLFSSFKRAVGDPFLKFIIGDLLVLNVFVIAATIISIITLRRISKKPGL